MAIKKLKALGNGISVITLSKDRFLVQSVPSELTMDHTTVIQLAEVHKSSTTCTRRRAVIFVIIILVL